MNIKRVITVSLGFAAFLGMNGFSLWGIQSLPQALFGINHYTQWSLPLLLANLSGFIGFALDARRKHPFVAYLPFPLACIVLGISVIFLIAATQIHLDFLITLSACAMGLGTTCCFICWEEIFGQLPQIETKTSLVGGSIGSIVPIFAALNLSDTLMILAFMSVLFLQLMLLYISTTRLSIRKDSQLPSSQIPSLSFFMRPIFCIMIIGAITPMLGSFAMSFDTPEVYNTIFILTGNVLAAVMLALTWRFITKSISITQAFSVIAPFLITTIIFFPFLIPQYRIIIRFFSTLGFSLFSIVMMMYCVDVYHQKHFSLRYTYAIFAVVTYASQLFATGISGVIRVLFPHESLLIYIHTSVLFALCLIVIFLLYLSTRKQKLRIPAKAEGIDTITDVCDQIAQTHHLTPRQHEVLTLIAHGFDVPAISNKLVLSENTVRTHVKNLYAILGVHSRRELIEHINAPNQTNTPSMLSMIGTIES